MVIIYGRDDCLACLQAKQLCEAWNFKHEFVDVKNSVDNRADFMIKYPNQMRLPVIERNGKLIGGYENFLAEIENTMNYGEGKL